MTTIRRYHTITEAKNGAGAPPIKTDKGWIHIAHGVRNTAAGLRYVLYAFATDLKDPSKVIAEDNGEVYIYYAASDTRMHVATTTIDKLKDYVFGTPRDPYRSVECVAQRCDFIKKNLEFLNKQ